MDIYFSFYIELTQFQFKFLGFFNKIGNDLDDLIINVQVRILHHSRVVWVLALITAVTASINDDWWTLIKLIAAFEKEFKKVINIMPVQVNVTHPYISMIFGLLNDPRSRSGIFAIFVLTKEILIIFSVILHIF